jgi:NAD(P)-dependent dehydrogenase (short-subunit alcohol dehydrogenase family)
VSTGKPAHAGKIALVTGANKGIGKEIARQLGAIGITVFAGSRDRIRGEQAVAELRSDGADIRLRSAEEGAQIAVHLANLGSDGPTGAFLGDDGPVPW